MAPIPQLDQASIDRAERVRTLSPGAHIHISGICGTGTAAVASLLVQSGFRVTGSDTSFYPPMGPLVRQLVEKVYEGYDVANLDPQPDLLVIGNSLSRGNVELEYAFKNDLLYASMPEVFSALLIGSREECKHSIVVAGTHGKTTTAAMIATLLDKADLNPGYFIGGVPTTLPSAIRPVDKDLPLEKRTVVLEGDEYDSACFAKWPKFHSYRPDILVITSLEFDHADIYESIEAIDLEFTRLAERVPASGYILIADTDSHLLRVAEKWQEGLAVVAPVLRYGTDESSDFVIRSRESANGGQGQNVEFSVRGEVVAASVSVSGLYNAMNLLAAAGVGNLLGLTGEKISAGLSAFENVVRRQQIVSTENDIFIIEDFAHHPTAVRSTLDGLREEHPKRRLIAVFEPRSNTSRRDFFQDQYPKSFAAADVVVIKEVGDAAGYSNTGAAMVALDVGKVVDAIAADGKDAHAFAEVDEIAAFIQSESKPGDLVVVMSNGAFGGLIGKLTS